MTLEDIVKELGDDKSKIIFGAIDAEKQRGIEASRKKGEEVKKFMTEANKLRDSLRALEIDPDANIDEQIDDFKRRVEKLSKEGEGSEANIKNMQRQLAQISQQLEGEKKEREAAQRKYVNSKISESLTRAFGDTVYGVDLVVKGLMSDGKVKMADGEKIVFVDGESELDLESGVKLFLEQRKDLAKNTQRPGSGSAPSAEKQTSTITKAQLQTMSVKEKAAFFEKNKDAKIVD